MADIFRISLICTANRARSAVAEACISGDTIGLPVEVRSAGVLGIIDQPALKEAVEAARAIDIDLSNHRSRCFADITLSESDLVLGFELNHIAASVVEGGAQPERTFMLKEFVRLVESSLHDAGSDPVEGARAIVAGAHRRRHANPGFQLGQEIADPVGQPARVFDATFRQICNLSEVLVEALFGKAARR